MVAVVPDRCACSCCTCLWLWLHVSVLCSCLHIHMQHEQDAHDLQRHCLHAVCTTGLSTSLTAQQTSLRIDAIQLAHARFCVVPLICFRQPVNGRKRLLIVQNCLATHSMQVCMCRTCQHLLKPASVWVLHHGMCAVPLSKVWLTRCF